jgi:glycine/D-amino acid oxidase-like deaminating enzyme
MEQYPKISRLAVLLPAGEETVEGAFDVIVVGLGAMGSSAAYHLSKRHTKVLGLEALVPAHDKGSSHGESRIIRQAYFEDSAYVSFTFFDAVRASVRLLSDPVTARKFFSLDWSDPVMEAVS